MACIDSRMLPHGAVSAGVDKDGATLYVIRAHEGQAVYPGKFNTKTNKASIAFHGLVASYIYLPFYL